MKLSAHYNKAIIIITILVLFAGGVIYFFTINHIARTALDNDLQEEIEEVEDYVNTNHNLPKQVDFDTDVTIFVRTDQTQLPQRFFDTLYNNPKTRNIEAGRAVSGLISLKGENFKVIVIVSRESTKALVQIIGLITAVLMIILVLVLFLTNRYILNDLWKPFYNTLFQLRSFNVSDNRSLNLYKTKVDEFNELNNTIQAMSSKVRNDFHNLKQFTENASHEMQTPLAVITAKLDTLIQDETIKPEQYDQINDIYAATNKLSRLNQSLLLLMKIENNLIDNTEPLSLDILIEEKIKQFHELIIGRNITTEVNLVPKAILASKYLIDILLNNLFSNAIRHNHDDGRLVITLTTDKLTFQNTGSSIALSTENLFERFQKGNKSEGTGLGLTIVKNICTVYGWDIIYTIDNPMHTFKIAF